MNCRTTEKMPSQNKVFEFMMTAIAYALFEHGFESEKIVKILTDIDDVADSMVKDYIKFTDIRRALKDEYNFSFNFN